MDKLELLKEQQNLEYTLKVLNEEILNNIEKRKGIAEYILEYRQKFIEEHRDDEDKLIEYFDHERYAKEQAYTAIDRKLSEYTKLKETPYFGKVNFIDDGLQEQIYIGRYGLTPEDTFENVIVDWRAPVSSLFYKGTLGETTYKAPNGDIPVDILARRQLIIKKSELEGCFDSEVDVKDEILQMVLSSTSGEKLKDIVMTIQKEQDEIIREDRQKVLVVNGVAGSGKTTIALHRVAYLLYNFREILQDKLLVLGPNDIFIDYIADVLPTLGESDVRQQTFMNFAIQEIGLTEDVVDFTTYLDKVLRGDEEAKKEIQHKTSEDFVTFLDGKLADLEENYFKIEPVIYSGEEIVSVKEIEDLFENYYKYMPLFRRSEKIKRILISKIKDKRYEEVIKLNKDYQEKIQSLPADQRIIEENDLEFKRRMRVREIVRESMNARAELEAWITSKSVVELYREIVKVEKLSYLDLPAILYMMVKLEGKKTKKEIKHIVIDEAQDYSMLQFLVLRELTGCKSYTIVGDANQRLLKLEETPAMLKLKSLFGGFVKVYELNKSYRSTQQIMEYANNLLENNSIVPFVREGKYDVEEVEVTDSEDLLDAIMEALENYDDDKYENIAVITKTKDETKLLSGDLKKFTKIMSFSNEDMIYKGGKVIIPSYFAKGLEFDGVIVVNMDEDTDSLLKYIMCTRALHRLTVINYKSK